MDFLGLTINGQDMPAPGQIPQGDTSTLSTIMGNGLILIFSVAAVIALFNLVRAGIQWTMSGGEKDKIAQARSRIIYSVIGLVIVLGAFFIVNFIFGLFKLGTI